MKRLLLTLLLLLAPVVLAQSDDQSRAARARAILKQVPLIDGHNDLPWELRTRTGGEISKIDLRTDTSTLTPPLQTDMARLQKGGVGAQFWSVYVPVESKGPLAVEQVLEQIDIVRMMADRYPETLEMAWGPDDIVRIHKKGKVASLVGVEGGHCIDNSLAVLRQLYQLGARSMTITHSKNNDWADSATDAPKHDGLAPFGKEVIREMNRLGMLVDLSHVTPKTMNDVLDLTAAPPIFSHSSARALVDHPRDVPDQVLARLAETDGVVMVTFVPGFISEQVRMHQADRDAQTARLKTLFPGDPARVESETKAWNEAHPAPKASVSDVADHIDHVRKVAGIDHIGLGGDLDGITTTIPGLDSVDDYPSLLGELLRRGYSEGDIKKIAGLNLLRVFRRAEEVAKRLRTERGPSEARFAVEKK